MKAQSKDFVNSLWGDHPREGRRGGCGMGREGFEPSTILTA
jgi:hypothetical protein